MLSRSHVQLCAECYCVPEGVTPARTWAFAIWSPATGITGQRRAQTWARGRSARGRRRPGRARTSRPLRWSWCPWSAVERSPAGQGRGSRGAKARGAFRGTAQSVAW